MSDYRLKRLAATGIFAAISIVILFAIPKFPLFLPFLEYDFADVPIILLTILYGPVHGLIVTAIVCIIQGFTLSAGSGVMGVLMHFIATGTYVAAFGLLTRKLKSPGGYIFSAFIGVLAWTAIMIPFNILITPLFMKVPREAIYGILLPSIIPFNLVKSAGNSAIALILFFTLDRVTRRALTRERDKFLKPKADKKQD